MVGWLVVLVCFVFLFFYFGGGGVWFINPHTVSMLSPIGEGRARGVFLTDITAPRVGIVKLWAKPMIFGNLLRLFILLHQSCFSQFWEKAV